MPLNTGRLPWRGIAWPFRFGETGNVVIAKEEEEVKGCLRRLLGTTYGEDPFLVKNGVMYGMKITSSLFGDLDETRDILVFETRLAIDTWEPRVIVDGIDFAATQRKVGVGYTVTSVINFRYRSTGRPDNLVTVH